MIDRNSGSLELTVKANDGDAAASRAFCGLVAQILAPHVREL